MDGRGSCLTGSNLGIGPARACRRCLSLLKVVLHGTPSANIWGCVLSLLVCLFFTAMSVGVSLSQNNNLFFIEINHYVCR